jgi:hypothetical protein
MLHAQCKMDLDGFKSVASLARERAEGSTPLISKSPPNVAMH